MINNFQGIREAFQSIWGYDDFRPPQGEIIRTLLASQDALIVMPTGAGKSICFQLPALLQTGLTLVVSPLVALMENQVQELRQRQLPGAVLHSELSKSERKNILAAIAQQKLRLLYLSPETLLSKPIWEILCQRELKVNGLILDEAHCLVQWGDTFRPTYRRLGTVRPTLLQYKPFGTKIFLAAFTATADPHTQAIIKQVLQLEKPAVFLVSSYRKNIHLQVKVVWTPRGRKQQALKFIQARKKQPGLVYVRSRRESEELQNWFHSLGYHSEVYHAGLTGSQRRKIEQDWLTSKIQFVVCTCAFGMGINKPDCRWIIHFHPPQLLSEYLQEVGRSGRDGKRADALTLISEPTGLLNPEDKQRQQFFLDKLRKQKQKAQQIANKIPERGEIRKIAREFPDGDISLALLHSEGKLKWLDPFHYQKCQGKSSKEENANFLNRQMEQMKRYLRTKECRWQFLLDSFGFTPEESDFCCGHCDNCNRILAEVREKG